VRTSQSRTYYGPFTLDDLRTIVKETEGWDGKKIVSVEVTPGDRPWESDQAYIEIG